MPSYPEIRLHMTDAGTMKRDSFELVILRPEKTKIETATGLNENGRNMK